MKNSYVPFYPSDWLAGTRGLTAAETGIYITLIAMMYERGEPLAMEHRRLARLCGTSAGNFAKALEALIDHGKIEDTDAGLWNHVVAKVLSRVSEKRTAASASAQARWGEKSNENNHGSDANAVRSQCENDAIQRPKAKDIDIVRFDEFWTVYPHRGGVKRNKKGARQKYEAAVKRGIPEQTIINGAQRAQNDRRVIDGFARDPTTWLNQEGWDDEIDLSRSEQNSDGLDRWKKIANG